MIRRILFFCLWSLANSSLLGPAHAADRPNVLFITVDDMSADSLGCFGATLANTSPNIDRLAASGLRFKHAHVVVGNCNPSRNCIFSGRFPHSNLVEGFYPVTDPGWPHLSDLVQQAGYLSAIRGKVGHSSPYQPYAWDVIHDKANGGYDMKNAQSFYDSTALAIAAAKKAGKPFFINVNISDPHKPFYTGGEKNKPSHVFTPAEVPVPGFLFDHPDIRNELKQYYDSVRRADDCTGKTLAALKDAGLEKQTIVFFLSDHGMPLPFAKTALWHHSTRTPLIVRWPGRVAANTWDERHVVSAVDLLPTWLDLLGIAHPDGLQGKSFAAALTGGTLAGRDFIIKEYNENAGGNRNPMRGVQTRDSLYLFNPWSNGSREFKTATRGTKTYRTMQAIAKTNPQVAARLKLFEYGVPEEFYDVASDPDCLNNLIDHPAHREAVEQARARLYTWMKSTEDHAIAAFEGRDDPAVREAYVASKEAESNARRAARRAGKAKKEPAPAGKGAAVPKQRDDLFTWTLPKQVTPGVTATLQIHHTLPPELGKQTMVLTLKGHSGKRLVRESPVVRGKGTLSIDFDVPEDPGATVGFAAYVGKDYQQRLQFRAATGVPVANP